MGVLWAHSLVGLPLLASRCAVVMSTLPSSSFPTPDPEGEEEMEVKGGRSKKKEREAKGGIQGGKGGREGVKRRNSTEGTEEGRKSHAWVPKLASFYNRVVRVTGKTLNCPLFLANLDNTVQLSSTVVLRPNSRISQELTLCCNTILSLPFPFPFAPFLPGSWLSLDAEDSPWILPESQITGMAAMTLKREEGGAKAREEWREGEGK
jgi:hypothetical protein